MFLDIALIHNNARVGSQIACALSKQMSETKLRSKTQHQKKPVSDSKSDIVSINFYSKHHTSSVFSQIFCSLKAVLLQVVIGGINVDFIAKGKTKTLQVGLIYNTYL